MTHQPTAPWSNPSPWHTFAMVLIIPGLITGMYQLGGGVNLSLTPPPSVTNQSMMEQAAAPILQRVGLAPPVNSGLLQKAEQLSDKSMTVADKALDTADVTIETGDRIVRFGAGIIDWILPGDDPDAVFPADLNAPSRPHHSVSP